MVGSGVVAPCGRLSITTAIHFLRQRPCCCAEQPSRSFPPARDAASRARDALLCPATGERPCELLGEPLPLCTGCLCVQLVSLFIGKSYQKQIAEQ